MSDAITSVVAPVSAPAVPSPAAGAAPPSAPGAATAAETAPDAKPVIEVDEALTRHVAQLAQLKRERAAEAKRAKDLEGRAKVAEDWDKTLSEVRAKKSAMAWLEKAGLTYDDVARELLGEQGPKPDPVKDELAALKKELADQKSWRESQESALREKSIREYREGAEKYLIDNADKYPYLKKLGKDGADIVWNVIVGQAKATNGQEVLTHEQAAARVNSHFEGLAKVLGESPVAPDQKQTAQSAQTAADKTASAAQPTKTSALNNNLSSGTTTPPAKTSLEDRIAAATEKLKADRAQSQARH